MCHGFEKSKMTLAIVGLQTIQTPIIKKLRDIEL